MLMLICFGFFFGFFFFFFCWIYFSCRFFGRFGAWIDLFFAGGCRTFGFLHRRHVMTRVVHAFHGFIVFHRRHIMAGIIHVLHLGMVHAFHSLHPAFRCQNIFDTRCAYPFHFVTRQAFAHAAGEFDTGLPVITHGFQIALVGIVFFCFGLD